MSYESWGDDGLTPLERASGVWGIIYGRNDGECSCGKCQDCASRLDANAALRAYKLENSYRFKEGAKLVAGISDNRQIKLSLIQKVRNDSLDSAIVRYMAKEDLPKFYAPILKNKKCLERLVEGLLYKVCKIQTNESLNEKISLLCNSLRINASQITAYERVSLLQQFIHKTVDQHLGVGTALSIQVLPMKNALSAARLHLGILDLTNGRPGYGAYIDTLSNASMQLEYDSPRPSMAPIGKQSWPRWRVRHLRPLSYYFSTERRALINALENLDEKLPSSEFIDLALRIYAEAS